MDLFIYPWIYRNKGFNHLNSKQKIVSFTEFYILNDIEMQAI